MKLPRDAFNVQSIKNLFLAGLGIWIITSITYWVLSILVPSLQPSSNMVVYCGIVAFVLALLTVVFLSDYKLSSHLSSYGSLLSYAILIYLIANGIQAVYSAIQPPTSNEYNQQAELIPFLDARPWLPPAGMKASLTKQTNQVVTLTSSNETLTSSLDSAITRLESCGLMTDSIFLTAIPSSREIGKGGVFRSDVVLAARLDKSYVKRITVNDNEIELKGGVGVFEENTGLVNQRVRNLAYKAEIELYGEEQTITTSDSYQVIRPYIEVSSQAVNSLFLNSGNQLNIQVPILGTDYRPKFVVDGGSFKYGNEPGKITVLPKSREVMIEVHNKGALIGKKKFPVRRIPAPTVKPYANGRAIDLDQGIPKSTAGLTLSVHADTEFERMLPKDANYLVQACEISLVSKGQLRGQMRGKANTNISGLTKRAVSGDQLKIEIQRVLRKNFKGDIEEVMNYYPKFFLVTLN